MSVYWGKMQESSSSPGTARAYAAARTIAPTVHAYFARRLAQARGEGQEDLASLPAEDHIEAVIDAAFWASLRREEGYTPKISMAYLSPRQAGDALIFERPLRLDPGILTRIAPAVERAGIHLGVWKDTEGSLSVWGATGIIPKLCF